MKVVAKECANKKADLSPRRLLGNFKSYFSCCSFNVVFKTLLSTFFNFASYRAREDENYEQKTSAVINVNKI
jgi:hypothetical protein